MINEKFLEGIGITDKDTVQKITETYAADIKAEQDAAAAVQTQLDEASKTIQSYKDMDIDGIFIPHIGVVPDQRIDLSLCIDLSGIFHQQP